MSIFAAAAMLDVLKTWEVLVLVYFLVVNGFYVVLLGSAGLELRRQARAAWREPRELMLGSRATPRISVIAPAYNEASTVSQSVCALLTLRYPRLEVVLVNDGSSDETLEVLQREFDLQSIHPIFRREVESAAIRGLYRSRVNPELLVVDKDNGGKADALNAGLNVATGTLVCAVDADTLIEPGALLRMVRPFLQYDDVVAAGGTVRVVNSSIVRAGRVVKARAPRTWLAGVQSVEYLRAFLFGRLGWNRLGGNVIVSGAFGLFRRDAMIGVGGYVHDTVGEDMELVAAVRRRGMDRGEGGRVVFVADPVAWTEVPESLKTLGRQRDRWQRGLADVLWRHRGVLGRPRYGALGLFVFPYFVVVELLGPVVEALGLIGLAAALALGGVDIQFAALFFALAYGFGIALNVATLVLEDSGARRYESMGDRLVMIPWVFLESLGYRQLTVFWRVRGLVNFLRKRGDWGAMPRRGFTVEPAEEADAVGRRSSQAAQLS